MANFLSHLIVAIPILAAVAIVVCLTIKLCRRILQDPAERLEKKR